jgi:outer membrane protein, heavy metal efflux system
VRRRRVWNDALRLSLKSAFVVCVAGALLAGCARFQDKPLSPATTAQQLESRSLSDARFRTFLETNLHRELASWPLKEMDFETLTLAAFYFHPNLDLARAQWASAKAGIKTAGGRPNPILGVTPGYSANPPRGVSPWFPSVTLDVPIETAGKRGYRIEHARHVSESARLGIASAAWQARSAVRVALLEYAAAQARAKAVLEQVGLQKQLTEALQIRFAAGAASTPEITPARIALLKLQADAADAQRLATVGRGRIAEATGLPLHAFHGVEFKSSFDQPADAALTSIDARRRALTSRTDIISALAEYEAAQSALQLEIAKQYPDVHLNPGYQYDQGENKWSLGLSLELPVLNRNQGPIAEASAKRDEAAAKFLAVQAKAISEIDRALVARAAAQEQFNQTEALLRVQRQLFEQTEASFKAGAADQLELAAARVELAAAELARLDAQSKRAQAAGLLEDALQRPFDALSSVEHDPKIQSAKNK